MHARRRRYDQLVRVSEVDPVSRVLFDTQVLFLSLCPGKLYRFSGRKVAEKNLPFVQGTRSAVECGGWNVEWSRKKEGKKRKECRQQP